VAVTERLLVVAAAAAASPSSSPAVAKFTLDLIALVFFLCGYYTWPNQTAPHAITNVGAKWTNVWLSMDKSVLRTKISSQNRAPRTARGIVGDLNLDERIVDRSETKQASNYGER